MASTLVRPILVALVASLVSAGCASESAEVQEAERRDTYVLTRLVSPRDVKIEELRIRDVDTESLYNVGGLPGEPLLLRVKAGRYRFKRLIASIPGKEKAPSFDQPERALEILGCCINYIGDVVITDRRDGYNLVVDPRPQTVIDAAALYPEAFAGKSVLMVIGDRETRRLVFESDEGEPLEGLEAPSAKD
jgi:hypothetical protein